MEKRIKIFKSFEEQELFHTEKMLLSTPKERFQNLFRMQQLTNLFHPAKNKEKKITIQKNGYPQ
jgi:hypothetical protein